MTTEEFFNIAAALKCAYPSANIMPDQKAIDVWFTMLSDIDYKVCQNAIMALISTCKFPPTIAEIREKSSTITTQPVKDWSEAWESVLKAISKYGYMQSSEALESMDEITRICTRRLGFQNICMSENVSADRANFRMIYDAELGKRKYENQLPERIRISINNPSGYLEKRG